MCYLWKRFIGVGETSEALELGTILTSLTVLSVDYTGYSDTSRANIRMAHENGELTVSLEVRVMLSELWFY